MRIPSEVYHRLSKQLPYSLGFSAQSLYFDGADYVDLAFFPYETADFTVEVIIKLDVLAEQDILTKGNNATDVPNFRLRVNAAGSVRMHWRDDASAVHLAFTPDDVTRLGRFYDIMFTRDGNIFSIYVNNILEAGPANPAIRIPGITTMNLHTLGALGRTAYTSHIVGEVAVARIYSRVLTEGERAYNMLNYHNPVRGGLEMWLADRYDAALATVYDLSGNARNGTNAGATRENLSKWELRSQMNL